MRGLRSFTFFINSIPLSPGILKSEIMRIYLLLLSKICSRAMSGSVNLNTGIPAIGLKASENKLVISKSSSTTATNLLILDVREC